MQTVCSCSVWCVYGSSKPQESHTDQLFTAAGRRKKEGNNGKAFEREKGGGTQNKNSPVFRQRLKQAEPAVLRGRSDDGNLELNQTSQIKWVISAINACQTHPVHFYITSFTRKQCRTVKMIVQILCLCLILHWTCLYFIWNCLLCLQWWFEEISK